MLDATKVGAGFIVIARVWLTAQDEEIVNRFVEAIKKLPQVMECHLMAGDCDFLLRVAVADLDTYRRFQIEHLNRLKGIQSIKTEIPMQKIKQSSQLPL